MTTVEDARTEIIDLFRTAWLADGTASSVPILYDNAAQSEIPSGEDANGRALPWCRISVRNLVETQQTLGAVGNRRYRNEGLVNVEIYTALGDGHTLGGDLARVAKLAFRGKETSGGVCFLNVSSVERGPDRQWFRIDVVADFQHWEKG